MDQKKNRHLNSDNLSQISARLTCPEYDRTKIKTGIVHIGVGGFHRAHQAYYIHQLLERGEAEDWGICGIGLREEDRRMYEILTRQDCLYTLLIQHPDGTINAEVIGSIKEMILAVESPQLAIDKMANPTTKIVSLTITEGGYNFNPATMEFNFNHPNVQHELNNPEQPKTVFGYLTAALRKRRENNLPAFSIMSCDNIQHNGDIARQMLLAFAERQDPALAKWIKTEVSFPNSMVDRITPVTKQEDINYIENTFALKDEWPVICEPFIQWVIEDNFTIGRPSLEEVGVQFVADVTPYEKMKIRLLNAGHSVLGIPGAVHGIDTINACMEDSIFSSFMRRFMDVEVTPILDNVKGIDINQYKDTLEERFSNPNIKDSVSRICSESSAKLPKFLIPTLEDNLKSGGSIIYASFVLACWCFYSDKETNKNGEAIEIIDVRQKDLHTVAAETDHDRLSFLSLTDLFGELKNDERFVETYSRMIDLIYNTDNVKTVMTDMMER